MRPPEPTTDGGPPFVLPSGLDRLERGEAVPGTDRLKLVNANRSTLVWSQRLESGETAFLKMYRHRRFYDWWRETAGRFRVQREFEALAALDGCGISCSKPLFWGSGFCRTYGHFEILATREVADAVAVDALILDRQGDPSDEELEPLFPLVARMHESGFHHGALYTRNVLVTENESGKTACHVIDVPKAIAYPFPITGTRMAKIDVLTLSFDLGRRIGFERITPLLIQYGFDRESAVRFIRRLKQYRPTRSTRNRHRGECQLRELTTRGRRAGVDRPLAVDAVPVSKERGILVS